MVLKMIFNLQRAAKVVLSSFLLCTPVTTSLSANKVVASTRSNKTHARTDKKWSKKLNKAGYVFKLPDAKHGTLFKINGKQYSKKALKKITRKKINFKVTSIKTIHNGIFVYLVSKNGKYKGYTTYMNGIYNKNIHNKRLHPLIETELKVMHAKASGKPTKKLLGRAKILSTKLTGKNKKIALTSMKQLKQFIKYGTIAETPVLLVGLYPGNEYE